jgi:hypothetical protein
VLRLILFHEFWTGPVGMPANQDSAKVKALVATPCTQLPRPTPTEVRGEWDCFTVSAVGIEEQDPLTGEERVEWCYSTSEDRQSWELPGSGSGSGGPEDGEDGGTLWLPGGEERWGGGLLLNL